MIDRFVYLKSGLAIVLAFVGAKMMLRDVFEIPTLLSLGLVVGILGTTIVISMIATRRANSVVQRDSTP
jgi:tellurite resistance protein TerC